MSISMKKTYKYLFKMIFPCSYIWGAACNPLRIFFNCIVFIHFENKHLNHSITDPTPATRKRREAEKKKKEEEEKKKAPGKKPEEEKEKEPARKPG